MPILEFQCDKGHEWEVVTTVSHDPNDLEKCPQCAGQGVESEARRKASTVADFVYTK